jgi:hypothetical protein
MSLSAMIASIAGQPVFLPHPAKQRSVKSNLT